MRNFKRILVIGDNFEDSFVDNILSTLNGMGFETMWAPANLLTNTKNVYARLLSSHIQKAFPNIESIGLKKIIYSAQMFDPDLIINTHSGVPPKVIELLKIKTKAKIVCWYTDSIANLSRQYLLASPYDIWFFKDPYMVKYFNQKLGLNTKYLPEACNPLWHAPTVCETRQEYDFYGCDIAVAGNMYYYRSLILDELKSCNIKIWGPLFPDWLISSQRDNFQKKYLTKFEKAKAFGLAKINLNTLHYTEIDGVNCRTFEIAGCGGFQLVDFKPSLQDFFEIGNEIETFESVGELKEKISYYLSHNEERELIAKNAFKRAHKDHTFAHRLNKLIIESHAV